MLDFAAVKAGKLTFGELTADLTVDDLRELTNEMIDFQLGLISDCSDEDVVFVPDDPEACATTPPTWSILPKLLKRLTLPVEE